MFVPMPPSKQFNRFIKLIQKLFIYVDLYVNRIRACPPVTKVAETASLVASDSQ